MPVIAQVAKDRVDMGAVLSKLAAAKPHGAFFPHFPAETISLFRQAAALGALEEVTMTGSAATVTLELLALPEVEGLHFKEPDPGDCGNANQANGRLSKHERGALISNPLSSPVSRTFRGRA